MRFGPPAVFLSLTLLLAVAAARGGASLNLPAPLVGIGGEPPRQASPPGRALLVVIDGLRADVARGLPFLDELGRGGARARLWADPPTFSTAQYVALLSGVPPRDSGVRTNETVRAAGVDDVARRARAAGLRTAVVSACVNWWERLFPASFGEARVVPTAGVVAEAERLMARADLLVVHLCAVDDAGHHAGARSQRYAEAAREADQMTAALARAWGWPAANVAVTADHGHRDGGGHGGEEADVRESFLVAGGPGVATGAAVAAAGSVDLAPTLAAWLGVASPAQAHGRTLVELLRAGPAARAVLVAGDHDRQTRMAAATAEARRPAERAEARARLWRGLAALLAAVAVAVTIARRRPRALARGVLGLAAAMAVYAAVFGPLSFSAARRAGIWVAAIALLSFAAAALALAAGLRRREGGAGLGAAAVVAGFAAPALVAFVHAGLFATRLTCEPAWVAAGPAFAYAALAGACAAATAALVAPWPGPAAALPPPAR